MQEIMMVMVVRRDFERLSYCIVFLRCSHTHISSIHQSPDPISESSFITIDGKKYPSIPFFSITVEIFVRSDHPRRLAEKDWLQTKIT